MKKRYISILVVFLTMSTWFHLGFKSDAANERIISNTAITPPQSQPLIIYTAYPSMNAALDTVESLRAERDQLKQDNINMRHALEDYFNKNNELKQTIQMLGSALIYEKLSSKSCPIPPLSQPRKGQKRSEHTTI